MHQIPADAVSDRRRPPATSHQPPLLDFHRISVMRGEKTVLHDITLRIQAGEHVAILGPNGCGKSTLIKTITRECYPLARDGSSLTLLGKETWNVFELRKLLGIVSNDLMSTCTREITGLEVVLSGFFSSIGIQTYHHVTPEFLKKAHEVLELLEVPHLADRAMTEMSSGEGRRILIARAMAHNPLALLLDEPTNSLDIHATLELRALLRKLARHGTGILVVTHHLPDIIPEIARVILLKEGRIFADGRKAESAHRRWSGPAFRPAGGTGGARRVLSFVVMLATLSQDLRYAARMLAKSPGFTLTAMLTLALGIGANTAIFSVANALLLRPLPYRNADDLVIATNARGPNRQSFSYLRAKFLEQHSRSFAGFSPFVSENFNLTGRGEPEQLAAVRVGWNFFDVLGVHPAMGRAFSPEDDRPGGRPVVLISESLWKRRFNGDPRSIGQSITLDSVDTTIIGVLSANFEFAPAGRSIDIWSSRAFDQNGLTAQQAAAGHGYVLGLARIRRGVSLSQAQAEMKVLDAQYTREHAAMPDSDPRLGIGLNQIQELMVANVRTAVLVLFGAVGLVLLIACANVASLLWSRAMARRKEIAIRAALGASRGEIVRQLLTESILLGCVSGALGVIVSFWCVRALAALPASTLPRINPIHIDGEVLAFALGLSLATSLLFGLMPTLQFSKPDVQTVLREEGRAIAGGRRRNPARGLLVVSQVALSMILLVGAGLLMRSFANLQNVPLGFNPRNVLLMDITLRRLALSHRCPDGRIPGERSGTSGGNFQASARRPFRPRCRSSRRNTHGSCRRGSPKYPWRDVPITLRRPSATPISKPWASRCCADGPSGGKIERTHQR